MLAGLTIYAVPQVLAATLPIGALSNQVGTIVKLVRVLMLGPVVLGLSLLARNLRYGGTGVRTNKSRPNWQELMPWFITGFLVVLIVRSVGLIPQVALPPITHIAAALTTIAMAALGLGVDIRVLAKSGVRVTLAVTASLMVLGLISYALIRLSRDLVAGRLNSTALLCRATDWLGPFPARPRHDCAASGNSAGGWEERCGGWARGRD